MTRMYVGTRADDIRWSSMREKLKAAAGLVSWSPLIDVYSLQEPAHRTTSGAWNWRMRYRQNGVLELCHSKVSTASPSSQHYKRK